MAVILRSNTDLVYLPDHGFVGEEGALRILPQITRHIHRLDISHNLLGSAGTTTLFKGLTTLRSRHSSPELGLGLWGLKEVNLGMNNLDDIALDGVLAYAKKDVFLKRILVQGNDISLQNNVESVVNSLNSSKVNSLSLVNNTSISPEGLKKFLGLLDSDELKQLHLSACNLPPSLSDSIAGYLSSNRSRNLESLELNGNHLGADGVTEIIDSIEKDNFTIQNIGLLANQSLSDQLVPLDDGDNDTSNESNASRPPRDPVTIDRDRENRIMEYQVHRRLPELLHRNRVLTRRIRQASLRALVPSRIIFNALPRVPTDEETAKRVIDQVANGTSNVSFPLLDLPEEVVHLIVRHTSGDPWAFSESQWTRLRKDSIDRENLNKLARLAKQRLRGRSKEEEIEVRREMREEWLRKGKWDKWER